MYIICMLTNSVSNASVDSIASVSSDSTFYRDASVSNDAIVYRNVSVYSDMPVYTASLETLALL